MHRGLLGGNGQTVLLLAAVAAGLPHGALDHWTARRAFEPRWAGRWWMPFLGGYLLLAGAVLFAWSVVPTAMLAFFLAMSWLHFGAEDNSVAGRGSLAGQLAHGGLPIALPILARPGDVRSIFSWLAGPQGADALLAVVAGPVAALWAAACAITFVTWVHRGRAGPGLGAAVEVGALACLFTALPPLTAFSVYFVAVHTPRALADLAGRLPADARSPARLASGAAPLTLLAICGGGILWWSTAERAFAADAARVAFMLLGALTVPHLWLEWQSERRDAGLRT